LGPGTVKYSERLGLVYAKSMSGNVWSVRLAVLEALNIYLESISSDHLITKGNRSDSNLCLSIMEAILTGLEDNKVSAFSIFERVSRLKMFC